MNVKLIAIAALGKNRQIGLRGDLPWSIPEEYRHFQETVKGHNVLVGRKNFESHQGDVEGAFPLVLTTNREYQSETAKIVHDLRDVEKYAMEKYIEKIFVIGGAEIYRLTLPFLTEFLWSEVDYDGPADAWFPEFLHYPWKEIHSEKHPQWTFRRLVKVPQKL